MRLFLAAVALAAATFLGACSGQDPSSEKPEQAATTEEKTTEATPEETTVERTTEVTVEAITEENVAPEVASGQDELARCEAELYATKGPNAIQRWGASEPEEKARMCTQLRGEPVPLPPSEAQGSLSSPDWRTPSQKAGVNEAGQDVSNTPVISPEERRERGVCFRNYFESLPPDQRGPESQRVTAEANAQGVTPYDIVGC
jgi:hypothetical protein